MNTTTTTNRFGWSLDSKRFHTTIYDKKKCAERVDVNLVYGFLKANTGISYAGITRYKKAFQKYENERTQIKNYKELYNRKTDTFQTSHHLAKHKWGRIQPTNYLSLSIFHRPTRHAFCQGQYVDFDMVNCQVVAISEICGHHNVDVPGLNAYVKDHKMFREKIMEIYKVSKDIAKQLPIRLMFGGSYDKWLIDNNIQDNVRLPEIDKIEKEMKNVMEIVYTANQHIKNDVLKDDPTKWSSELEAKRGVMALWSQSIEKLIQEDCIQFLVDKKKFVLEDIVPCQDGFMVLKSYAYPKLCDDLYSFIKSKYNISIRWANKEFDEAIHIEPYEGKSLDEWTDLLSRKCLADRFILEYGNYVIIDDDRLYTYRENKWYDETISTKRNKVVLYIAEDLYSILRGELEDAIELSSKEFSRLFKLLRDETSRGNSINDIIKHIISKTAKTTSIFNKKPFLLGFDNGVYDLQKHIFRPYQFEDYMTVSTNYNYQKPNYNDKKVLEARTTLENIQKTIQPDPQMRKLLFQVQAAGLDGINYQNLFFLNGVGGNGKGLNGGLMQTVLGDYFLQPGEGILKCIEKANGPSPDLYALKNVRYCCFTEIEGKIRITFIRKLTGGNTFTARLLNQNPEEFKLNCIPVVECNVLADLDGKPMNADYRRLGDINFPSAFTDDKEKIGKTINGVTFHQGNREYERDEWYQSMRDIWLDMLLETYKKYSVGNSGIKFDVPKSALIRIRKYLQNQDTFLTIFNQNWKIQDSSQPMSLKSMWQIVKESEDYHNLSYENKRLYSRDRFYSWVTELSGVKDGGGNTKTGKLVYGIQPISDDHDGDEEEKF